MNFRLPELARRFQDLIDGLTDAREWTAGTVSESEAEEGTSTTRRAWTAQRVRQAITAWWDTVSIAISKVTGLSDALDGKANLTGGNIFTGIQNFLPNQANVQRLVREISSNLSSSQSKIILLGSMSTGRTRISGLITTSIGTTGGNRDCVTALISSLVDVPTGSPTTQVSYSITQGNTEGNPARLITCEYENEPYLAIQMWPGGSGNRMPQRWFFQGSDYTQDEPNSLELPLVVDVSSVSDITPFTAGERGHISESGTKQLDGDMTVAGDITANDFITASRVESNRENALSVLDNLPEWIDKDGNLDYKKHYAYSPRFRKDEKGSVVDEKPGLSMEKRVAMLEKMIFELRALIDD